MHSWSNLCLLVNEEEIKEELLSKEDGSPIMYCPFYDCKKPFRHSGNLKTHIRSHVRKN